MLTIVSFVLALGLLIAIHEYGHYRVAVACGVQVTRFSVGFGMPLVKWKPKKTAPGTGHRVCDCGISTRRLCEDGRAG